MAEKLAQALEELQRLMELRDSLPQAARDLELIKRHIRDARERVEQLLHEETGDVAEPRQR